MKERAAHMASPTAGVAERLPLRIGKVEKGVVGAGRNQRRVVEFMPADRAAGSPERAVGEKPRFTVTEM